LSEPDEPAIHRTLPPDLAEALARARPRLGRFADRIWHADALGSTNDAAARLAGSGAEEGTTVVADAQTAGRGRLGRAWYSPPGAGLYTSVVLRSAVPHSADSTPSRLSLLTLAVGVALAEALRLATALPVDIKWPNDLMIGRRKVGGILAEGFKVGAPSGFVVVGFGINLRTAAYPPDVESRATSVEAELGRPADRGVILAEALAAIDAWLVHLLDGRFGVILSRWQALAPSCRGAWIRWTAAEGTRRGLTAGIDQGGALLVSVGDRTERLIAGEITWE
jgi:BirA family transcriptional regulator, biotin operon repressor / biotin---[acetyl-CoA-carboxylase] ligase